MWSGEAKEYDVPVQPSNPDGDNWLDKQSLLYHLGWESNEQAERICEETGDDTAYDTARADFENAVIAAMQQCDREGVFGNRAENGLLLFAYYADAHDDNKPEAEQLLHRSAKALNGKKGYDDIVADGTEQQFVHIWLGDVPPDAAAFADYFSGSPSAFERDLGGGYDADGLQTVAPQAQGASPKDFLADKVAKSDWLAAVRQAKAAGLAQSNAMIAYRGRLDVPRDGRRFNRLVYLGRFEKP